LEKLRVIIVPLHQEACWV